MSYDGKNEVINPKEEEEEDDSIECLEEKSPCDIPWLFKQMNILMLPIGIVLIVYSFKWGRQYEPPMKLDLRNWDISSHFFIMIISIVLYTYGMVIHHLCKCCSKRIREGLRTDFHFIASLFLVLGVRAAWKARSKIGAVTPFPPGKIRPHFESFHGQLGRIILLLVCLYIVLWFFNNFLGCYESEFYTFMLLTLSYVIIFLIVVNATLGLMALSYENHKDWAKNKIKSVKMAQNIQMMILYAGICSLGWAWLC